MGNVIAALCDKITFQKVQPDISPVLSFPGLEIKQHQRRVLRDGNEVPLTRNEYGVLAYLAAYPGHVFSKEQIFEEVWSMERRKLLLCGSKYNLPLTGKKLSRTGNTQPTSKPYIMGTPLTRNAPRNNKRLFPRCVFTSLKAHTGVLSMFRIGS